MNTEKTILVAGYFDPIHPGHLEHFRYAKQFGQVIVATHPVEHILEKSPFYVYTLEERMSIIEGFTDCVDRVVACDCVDVSGLIRSLRPNFFLKGPDYEPQNVPIMERDACIEVNCVIIYQPGLKRNNSSNIKKRIINQVIGQLIGDRV